MQEVKSWSFSWDAVAEKNQTQLGDRGVLTTRKDPEQRIWRPTRYKNCFTVS